MKFFHFIFDSFLKVNIARKIFLGYFFLLALLVVISLFALTNLNKLNNLNSSILEVDVPIVEASKDMIDAMLSQELYARRYAILKTPDILRAFWERNSEFKENLDKVRAVPEDRGYPLDNIETMHNEYNRFLIDGLDSLEEPSSNEAKEFNNGIKDREENIINLIKLVESDALFDQKEKTRATASIGALAFKVAVVLCIMGFLISVSAVVFVTVNISGAVNKLKDATEKIAEGDFDYIPNITNRDEIGELSDAFVTMAKRLKKLEEMYIDTSPLTRMPGGIAIENIMKKRIKSREPIAFCLLDLDSFKAYNDHYGYAQGNKLIIKTADIIEKYVQKLGNEEDFAGHIGGDDFVIISTPDKFSDICNLVVDEFDKTVPSFYDAEDRERGYIEGLDRHGNERQFPLATISIAVVTNVKRKLKNHIQFGEIAAELKEYAKSLKGSVYVVDQRRQDDVKVEGEDELDQSNKKVVKLSRKRVKKKDEA